MPLSVRKTKSAINGGFEFSSVTQTSKFLMIFDKILLTSNIAYFCEKELILKLNLMKFYSLDRCNF